MNRLLRGLAVFGASWAAAAAAAFVVLGALSAGARSGAGAAGYLFGSAVVAVLLVPYGVALLGVAESAAMRITAPSRILGAALLSALPCFGAVIVLERVWGLVTPVEGVAFAAAGVAVGVLVGIMYPWFRGPFPRRRRRRPGAPREDAGPPAAVGG